MPWWKNTQSVRGPLITAIGLILVAGFLATNIINYQVSKGSLRQALIDRELPLTSNNIYSEIQNDLLRPVFIASMMSNDTFVKNWLLDGEHDVQKITRYLDEIRKKYGVFTSFLVSDKTHNYYHFGGLSQTVSIKDPNDAWYFRVRDMKEAYEVNLDFNAAQGNTTTIFINHKVLDRNQRFLGAIGVGLTLNTVARIVERYKEYFGRNIYFVDNTGHIAVHSRDAAITEQNILTAPGISTIAKAIMGSDHGFFEYDTDGETMILSTRRIPELGWWVVVEQREADALGPIRKSLITTTMVGLGIIAITLLLVSYTVNLFHSRLETMASTDKLTGLGNRQTFDLRLAQALIRHQRDKVPFSVILFDLDQFKRINDTLGHLQGDKVLRKIADVVGKTVRVSDTLCRWGGEELVVLAHNCALDQAAILAEKVRKAIETTAMVSLPDGSAITTSAGVSEAQAGDTADAIIGRADQALYHAKQQGRNRVCRS